MLGSEGRLGHWEMPEAEPDMQQKNEDNLNTLQNSLMFVGTMQELHEADPDKAIILKQGKGKKETRFLVTQQAENIWEGMGIGAINELMQEGLDVEVELIKIRNGKQ